MARFLSFSHWLSAFPIAQITYCNFTLALTLSMFVYSSEKCSVIDKLGDHVDTLTYIAYIAWSVRKTLNIDPQLLLRVVARV